MSIYSDLNLSLKRARERSAAKPTDDEYLLELLQLSFGRHKLNDIVVYRPFYVAAQYLEQSRRDQTISQATDVKFMGQEVPIASLLDLQRALDQDLIIPSQFRIAVCAGAGNLEENYNAAIATLKQYQPRGYA
jgi:hypothetical protein